MDDPALNKQPQTTSSIPAMTPDDSSSFSPPPPVPNQDFGQTPPPAGAGAGPNDAVIPDTPSPSTGRKRFGGGRFIATIFGVLLLLGGAIAGVLLVQQQQEIREKAGAICCSAGNCNDGSEFQADTVGIPQSSCGERAREFCESRNSTVRDAGTEQPCPGTTTTPPGGTTGTTGGTKQNGESCTPGGTIECQSGFCVANCRCNQTGGFSADGSLTGVQENLCAPSNDSAGCTSACNTKYGVGGAGGTGGSGSAGVNYNGPGSDGISCNNGTCKIESPVTNDGARIAGLFISDYQCDSPVIPCNQNSNLLLSGVTGSATWRTPRSCGSGQIDVRNSAGTSLAYSTYNTGLVCGAGTGAGTGGGGGCVVDYSQAGHNSCITNPIGCPSIQVYQFHAPGTPNTQGQCFTSENRETITLTGTVGGNKICVPEIPCGYCYQLDVDGTLNPGVNTGGVSGYTGACDETAGITAQCLTIKIYDSAGTLLTAADYTDLAPGQTIRLAVGGSTTSPALDKARFTTNGTLNAETALKNATGEFYMDYVLPEATTFTFQAQLHHTNTTIGTGGWF